MAKAKHELEVASNAATSELDPNSKFMAGLQTMIWGNNAPFATDVPKGEARDMFAAELATPQGRMNLITRYGQQQTADIEQELVKSGHVDTPTITDPSETASAN
jgi:hypothetical protein